MNNKTERAKKIKSITAKANKINELIEIRKEEEGLINFLPCVINELHRCLEERLGVTYREFCDKYEHDTIEYNLYYLLNDIAMLQVSKDRK